MYITLAPDVPAGLVSLSPAKKNGVYCFIEMAHEVLFYNFDEILSLALNFRLLKICSSFSSLMNCCLTAFR